MDCRLCDKQIAGIPAAIREAAAARMEIQLGVSAVEARNMSEAAAFVMRRLVDVQVEDLVATVYHWIDFEAPA